MNKLKKGMITIAEKTVSFGSSGSDVKKLQEKLNSEGYSLTVDGKFGQKTQAAVRDYQKKKGLSVDGIVGVNTWSALNSSKSVTKNKTAAISQTSLNNQFNTPKPQYIKSDALTSSEKALTDWENNKPSEYNSKYSEEIEKILNSILNREQFDYKTSTDPLYEQYKELYIGNGKKAMQDTIGNASALTGGYDNSYAQTAGSVAYEEYLTQLNNIALDLRDRAYEQYVDEGDKLLNDVTLLRTLDGDDYEKYLNELERYYDEGSYLLEKLSSMSDSEFKAFAEELEAWENDREYAFKKYQDSLDREEFEKELSFKKSEAQREQANKDREYSLAVSKAHSSGSSNSSKTSDDADDNGSVSLYPTTYKEFCSRTGITTILTQAQFEASEEYKSAYKGEYKAYLKAMYNKYK